jgi:hypothetical protein
MLAVADEDAFIELAEGVYEVGIGERRGTRRPEGGKGREEAATVRPKVTSSRNETTSEAQERKR